MRLLTVYTMCAFVPLIACGIAQAQQGQGQGQGGKPPEPPAEAFTACAGRNAGDTVSFTTKDHTIQGTCENIGGRLALRPSQPPPGGRGTPPSGSSDSGQGPPQQ